MSGSSSSSSSSPSARRRSTKRKKFETQQQHPERKDVDDVELLVLPWKSSSRSRLFELGTTILEQHWMTQYTRRPATLSPEE
mmetsp:Transcript_19576/g.19916  ORF Transcript_19576/g.19916 Transcript_19576/m.19916 type:complete len:82 (+) Transcript_19576:253-498(+)